MENKKVYIETYGCQMNFSDTEIIGAILEASSYTLTNDINKADVIFLNTCSIRENAEQKIRNRLKEIQALKKGNPGLLVGVLGCMAERLKEKLLYDIDVINLIAGPDAYRSLPALMDEAYEGNKSFNLILSEEETYDNIQPVRINSNGVNAFISIMRGCENFCSYCVVPYTRGKERSRPPQTILNEAEDLFQKGFREICLLGQNVNSYKWSNDKESINFADLISKVAMLHPEMRIRFATSHPKDISDELIIAIAAHKNICNAIHLPFQSGSNRILKLMNRKYTREWYLDRINKIKEHIPDCALSTDIISGFCSETEEDHKDTLSLMETVGYDYAFMFKYSERPGTAAAKRFTDDIPEDIKKRRLNEIISLQQKLSLQSNKKDVGKTFEVLIEGKSHRSDKDLYGRNSQNKVLVFPRENYDAGMYVNVKVNKCTAATLLGNVVNNE